MSDRKLQLDREVRLDGTGMRIGIVASRFNDAIVQLLLDNTGDRLSELGVSSDDVSLVWVPGAFELAVAAKAFAEAGNVDAVMCLGTVIRGETAHFDFVAGESAAGCTRVALDTGVPTIFGVLTTDTVDQALDRAEKDRQNKGAELAEAAVEMVQVLREIRA